jgi:hypothetical protein
MAATIAPTLTFLGRLVAVRPSTLLRTQLDASRAAPAPGEYVGRLRSHSGWRTCSISVLADDASLVLCRPRPAAPKDVIGENVEIELSPAIHI